MKKLTNLQIATLTLISEGKVSERNTGYGSWRIQGASPPVVGLLKSRGYAKNVKEDDRTYRFFLTPEGEAALKATA